MAARPAGPRLSALRHVPQSLGAAVLALLMFAAAAPAAAGGCPLASGQPIVLASESSDPDVFVWDSRERLVDYAGGHWGSTKAVLTHTRIASPGTRATVVACQSSLARRRGHDENEDVIGVKLTSGPGRGKYGWVLSSEVRGVGRP
ncbi:MAG: hypothetical protein GIW95_10700 [Candidatus Eremiobacteraeota bacterium]|nr:hypothetical protein [Candidatus Eremiobacteraeota bacterium]